MRIVTSEHLQRFEKACDTVGALAAHGRAAAEAAGVEFTANAKADRRETAASIEARALARAHLLMADAGAQLEIAAVGFLGERRWPGEGISDFLERLLSLCTDLSTVLATQRANGLQYRP
jgi:hypothetical protein